jgi:hypothetical protein
MLSGLKIELVLFEQKGYLDLAAAFSKNLANGCKIVLNKDNEKNIPSLKSDINIIFERHANSELRGSPSLVGRGIANLLQDFEDYLKSHNRRNVRQILCYARKYHNVLLSEDASIIARLHRRMYDAMYLNL